MRICVQVATPLMMAVFVTMVTETDGKPANKYKHVEGSKPMYRKKFRGAMRLFDPISEDAKSSYCCVCPCDPKHCMCCYCQGDTNKSDE